MKTIGIVTDLLSEILSGDARDMGAAFRLTEENDVMPIDIAKLAIACERAFSLSLYDEKIAQWNTIGDVCEHIDALLEEGLSKPPERSDEERIDWYYE